MIASAAGTQGWSGGIGQRGSAKPATQAKPSSKTTSTAKKPSSKRSSAQSPKTTSKKNSSSAGHQKKTAPTMSTAATAQTATTPATRGSRERRVTDAGSTAATESASPAAMAKSGKCNPDKDERVDLSGSYGGVINYPAAGMSGSATLTITGNRFTLNTGSRTETGNITAIATCNYIAVAMMFGQWKTPQPGEVVMPPLPMLSLRAIKKADQLALKASASERREFLFEPNQKK